MIHANEETYAIEAGIVFLAGALLMTYNLTMTIKGRRTVQVQPPEVTAYRM